jgi:ABC-2 type transport system permease protein
LFGMVFAIVALALATGAAYPNLDADNAARVAASAGGLVFMVLCMSFIGAVVVLEAWPVYAVFSSRFTGVALGTGAQLGVAASFAGVVILIAVVLVVSIRVGIQKLEAIEP